MTTNCRWFSCGDVERAADRGQRRDHRVDGEGVERHQPGEHARSSRACRGASRRHGPGIRTWEPRLLADCAEPCNSGASEEGDADDRSTLRRRHFLQGAGALAAAMTLPLGRVFAAGGRRAPSRFRSRRRSRRPSGSQRIARARALMQQHGIGAIIVESGPSLDYFTGVQWWRSERLTGGGHPGAGRPDHRHALLRAAVGRRKPRQSRPKSAPGTRTRSR